MNALEHQKTQVDLIVLSIEAMILAIIVGDEVKPELDRARERLRKVLIEITSPKEMTS